MVASNPAVAMQGRADRAHVAGSLPSSITDLAALIPLAESLGSTAVASELQRLVARMRDGRVHLACLGQFKRGKSTLINAILGQAVLPTGVTPVTSVVTVLQHGDSAEATARFLDGTSLAISLDALADYVTERLNPGNRRRVAAVEVSIPSPLLAGGLCLVDTPGVGSVFAANSGTTRTFLPQIDAILLVVGADPPVSGEELDMVMEVGARTRDLLVVLNKADRVGSDDLAEAAAFTERVVSERLGVATGPPACVSATERLAGHATRDWEELIGRIRQVSAASGALLAASGERHVARLAHRLRDEVREQREALTRPLRDSETRLAELRTLVGETERALHDLRALLALEQERLRGRFAAWRRAFLETARPQARQELERALANLTERQAHEPSMEMARRFARTWVSQWYDDREPEARAAYVEVMARYTERARELSRRVSSLTQSVPDGLDSHQVDGPALTPTLGFCFTDVLSITSPGLWAWLVDTAGPAPWSRALARRRAVGYLDRLIVTNSARLANDFEARVLDSREAMEREIRTSLDVVVAAAERALDRATARHTEGLASVRDALVRLGAADQHLLFFTDRRHAGSAQRSQERTAS